MPLSAVLLATVLGAGLLIVFISLLVLWQAPSSPLARHHRFTVTTGLVLAVVAAMMATAKEFYGVPSWGAGLGPKASESFTEGNNAAPLQGVWEMEWYEYDDDGKPIPFRYEDDNGELRTYETTHINLRTRGNAVVSGSVPDQNTGQAYWMEGRLSSANHLTLMYWSRHDSKVSPFVGVLTLHTRPDLRKDQVLHGYWVGYDPKVEREDKLCYGEVRWTRK